MKFLVFFFAVLNQAWALDCPKTVNPKKAVIFINTNSSYLEVEAAQEAACERGESFVLIPSVKYQEEMISLYKNKIKSRKDMNEYCNGANADTKKCNKVVLEYSVADNTYHSLMQDIPRIDPTLLSAELTKLAQSDVAVTSVVMSGHDGGGAISGELGRISKSDFINTFNKAYSDKPLLKDELKSALLWGCYTTTKIEIIDWKSRLPHLKVIAGFEGSGPSNLRESGHALLKDVLTKEKSLVKNDTEEAAKIAIEGLDGAWSTYVGIYAQCNENKDEYYLFNRSMELNFQRFNASLSCTDFENEKSTMMKAVAQYSDGSLEIPEDTSHGPLRDLYSKARSYAHCIDQDSGLNADRIGLLLFSKGVQANFSQTFEKEIGEASVGCTELKKIIKDRTNDHSLDDVMKYLNQTCEAYEKLKTPDTAASLPRKSIAQSINYLDTFRSYLRLTHNGNLIPKLNPILRLSEVVDNHLYNSYSICMDFDLWHDYKKGTVAKSNCPP